VNGQSAIKQRVIVQHYRETINSLNTSKANFFSLIAFFNCPFSIDWLVSILGQKASVILLRLEEGIEWGWLGKSSDGDFYFKDTKVSDELLKRLPPHEKESLQKKIIAFLQEEFFGNADELLPLCHQLLTIRCDGQLCRILMEAGDMYLKSFRTEEALQCYSKILDDLSGREGCGNDELFMEAAIRYSKNTTSPLHDCLTIVSVLKEALAKAADRHHEKYQALLLMHLAKNEWLCSKYKDALKHFDQGWALTSKLDHPSILRSTQTFATYFSFWQGRFLEGISNYEKFMPDVQIYPEGQFPLLAALFVGYCYAQIGQITQGVGMLDAIYDQCRKKGDSLLSTYARQSIGLIMLDMGKTDEALEILEPWVKRAQKEHNDWAWIGGELGLATGYYRKGEAKQAVDHLEKYLKASKQVQIKQRFFSYLFELCFAIRNHELPDVSGLSLDKEIYECMAGKNIFLKGLAYRYKALLQKQEGRSEETVIQLLRKSVELLMESGHQLQLAMTQFEMARQYLHSDMTEEARETALAGSRILSFLNEDLIPQDIRNMTREASAKDDVLDDILKMSRELVTIRDNNELFQSIISRVNRITGAERGAIFLLEKNSSPPAFLLRASKNLTSEQVDEQNFAASWKIIRDVAETRKGTVVETDPSDHHDPGKGEILSRICVPLILRNEIIGVLYNDNRFMKSAFSAVNLNILEHFASQAAIALDNALSYEKIQNLNQKLKAENLYYMEQQRRSHNFEDIIGESDAIRAVLTKIEQVAMTDSSVLILGETGVGKEMVARAIHRCSSRRDKSFISVLCNAMSDSLLPSELFGHEKGAFTGATGKRLGRFELADGGTLFLDEIGDLPPDIQIRLLRVLQNKEFERVGGSDPIFSDFRLIAATNRDLTQDVNAKKFRSDLYYRINVFPITVPPLRERRDDIPLLADHFLKSIAIKMGKEFAGISTDDMNKLMQYGWPGNIRELRNVIERGVILSENSRFRLPELNANLAAVVSQEDHIATLKEIEYRHILNALQKTGWKIRGSGGAAALLDIHPSTLDFRIKKLGISRMNKS